MERALLRYSIEQIERLRGLFESEIKSINRKSKKGMKENQIGFSIVSYIRTLSINDERINNSDSYKAFKKYMERFVEIVPNPNSSSINYTLKNLEKLGVDENFDPQSQCVEFEKYMSMPQLFCEETIIMLMVKFEESISNILSCLYRRFPDKYLSDKTIPYSEVLKLNCSEVEGFVVDKLIEETMRKDYTEWFKIFESHGMNFKKYNALDDFIELYFRRNLVVHNKSIVNDSYLSGIKSTSVSKPKKNDYLMIDEKYVMRAFDIIECVLVSIFIECNRFYKNEQKLEYLNNIFILGFDFLTKDRYLISEFVFKQLENSELDENTKIMAKVNRWISQKNINGLSYIRQEIDEADFSALKDDFVLAKQIILENYDLAYPLLEEMITNPGMTTALEQWPLFKDFRNTDLYIKLRKDNKNLFDVKELESNNEENSADISFGEMKSNMESVVK